MTLFIDPGTKAVEREQGRPHADYEIMTHGNLELFAKACAKRFGWEAEVKNRDIDPLETQERGYTFRAPGRGDIILSRNHDATVLEYHLPEFAIHLWADIEATIRGHQMDRDRRLQKTGPLVLGG